MKHLFSLIILVLSLTNLFGAITPPKLEKGDLIALVCPAWSPKDLKEIEKVSSYLNDQGYLTICYPEVVTPKANFSDTDSNRAKSLMEAWKNPDVKAVWCVRGGWGSSKILDLLDYEWIKTHPKILIGMSDITSLHAAIIQKTDLITFLGPVLTFFINDDFEKTQSLLDLESLLLHNNLTEFPLLDDALVINNGSAEGQLVGGNLTLIASLCGTPWQLDTKNKILIIEDIGERPYKVDRYLWQLKEAGLLDNLAGLIIGEFVDCNPRADSNDESLLEVFETYFADVDYPVIYGLANGHGDYQTTLPLNGKVRIDTLAFSVTLLEEVVD